MFPFEHFPVCTRITGQGGCGKEGGHRGGRGHRREVREAAPGEGVTRGREVKAGNGQISEGRKRTIRSKLDICAEMVPIPDVLVSVGLLYPLVLGPPVLEPDLDLRL